MNRTPIYVFLFSILITTFGYPDALSTEINSGQTGYQVYQIFLIAYFIMMIVTMFKGYGEDRTITIFRDYNDLGLTFLIPASFVLIYILFASVGGNPKWDIALAVIVALILFLILGSDHEICWYNSKKRFWVGILMIYQPL